MSCEPCGCDPEANHICAFHRPHRIDLTERLRSSLQASVREVTRAHDRIALLQLELKEQISTIAQLRARIIQLDSLLLQHGQAPITTMQRIGQEVI